MPGRNNDATKQKNPIVEVGAENNGDKSEQPADNNEHVAF